eukprot:tig00020816_g14123.t1
MSKKSSSTCNSDDARPRPAPALRKHAQQFESGLDIDHEEETQEFESLRERLVWIGFWAARTFTERELLDALSRAGIGEVEDVQMSKSGSHALMLMRRPWRAPRRPARPEKVCSFSFRFGSMTFEVKARPPREDVALEFRPRTRSPAAGSSKHGDRGSCSVSSSGQLQEAGKLCESKKAKHARLVWIGHFVVDGRRGPVAAASLREIAVVCRRYGPLEAVQGMWVRGNEAEITAALVLFRRAEDAARIRRDSEVAFGGGRGHFVAREDRREGDFVFSKIAYEGLDEIDEQWRRELELEGSAAGGRNLQNADLTSTSTSTSTPAPSHAQLQATSAATKTPDRDRERGAGDPSGPSASVSSSSQTSGGQGIRSSDMGKRLVWIGSFSVDGRFRPAPASSIRDLALACRRFGPLEAIEGARSRARGNPSASRSEMAAAAVLFRRAEDAARLLQRLSFSETQGPASPLGSPVARAISPDPPAQPGDTDAATGVDIDAVDGDLYGRGSSLSDLQRGSSQLQGASVPISASISTSLQAAAGAQETLAAVLGRAHALLGTPAAAAAPVAIASTSSSISTSMAGGPHGPAHAAAAGLAIDGAAASLRRAAQEMDAVEERGGAGSAALLEAGALVAGLLEQLDHARAAAARGEQEAASERQRANDLDLQLQVATASLQRDQSSQSVPLEKYEGVKSAYFKVREERDRLEAEKARLETELETELGHTPRPGP